MLKAKRTKEETAAYIMNPSADPADEEKRLTYVAFRLFLCIPTEVAINGDELNALDLRVIDLRENL